MNRIEKLLFSKRSPLRRALTEETSREERLKLLPDIAKQMFEAGLISRELEREVTGYARKSTELAARPDAMLDHLFTLVAQAGQSSRSGIENVYVTLGHISRIYFSAFIHLTAEQGGPLENYLAQARELQDRALTLLRHISAYRPVREIPIVGILFELSTDFQTMRSLRLTESLLDLDSRSADIRATFGLPAAKGNGTQGNDSFNPKQGSENFTAAFDFDKTRAVFTFIPVVVIVAIAIIKLFFNFVEDAIPILWTSKGATDAGIVDSLEGYLSSVNAYSPFNSPGPAMFIATALGNQPILRWLLWGSVIWLLPAAFILALWLKHNNSLQTIAEVMLFKVKHESPKNYRGAGFLLKLLNVTGRFLLPIKKIVIWFVVPAVLLSGVNFAAATSLRYTYVGYIIWLLFVIVFSSLRDFGEREDADKDRRTSGNAAWVALIFSLIASPLLVVSSLAAADRELLGVLGRDGSLMLQMDSSPCPDGMYALPAVGRYIRIGGETGGAAGHAQIKLRPQDLPAQTATASDGVLVANASSTADWGLAKRGSGVPVKPVEIIRALQVNAAGDDARDFVLEPAYVNVKLCVREGAELPPELAALGAEGAN